MAEERATASKRLEAARAFRERIAKHPELRDRIPEKVIVVLSEDRISTVFNYVSKHHPSGANLVCVYRDHVSIISVQQRRTDNPHVSKLTIAPESEIGMLFHFLTYGSDQPFEITIESPDLDNLLQAERLAGHSLLV